MVQQPSYWKVLTRRKVLKSEEHEEESKLNRVLGLYDLTALGVGSTLGAGVYVLAGQIAKEQAGPSVIISFAIAALASLLAGVCYAEFGARVPKAGSAYVYSYVCIGEFVAFVIGWNLILEYVIGTAAVCRGISLYLDTLINDTLKTTFAEIAPINVSFLGAYFDFFAFGLVVVFGVALAFGVETSAIANNFCTCLNLSILLFVIIAGSIKANFANWSIDVADLTNSTTNSSSFTDLGSGGFFPFGITGTLKGAATCFFGFVGFDCIATTGEEVRNPRKNIPRSILLSLLLIFLCYFGVSMVLTLMIPYYEQDVNAPLPYAFKMVGWNFAMWIVSVGGLIGLLASLFGALFPLPRVMYSMAEDGLLFRFLGKISPKYQVPVGGSIFAAVMTALISGLFDLAQLVNLLSIGTLLAYTVVAISITILRYMDNSEEAEREQCQNSASENSLLTSAGIRITFGSCMKQLFNCQRMATPNSISTFVVGSLITIFCLLSIGIGLIFMQAYDELIMGQVWVSTLLGVLVLLTVLVLLAICLQPRENYSRLFRVPWVPIVPAISIFINIYLMLQLDVMTWIRFGIWMIIGIPLYVACYCMYDVKNPLKRNPDRIEFAKLLRANPKSVDDDAALFISSKANYIDNLVKEKLVAMQQSSMSTANERSVQSLDEIMDMNAVGNDLIEIKHANGKVFYVEDNKSNSSTLTLAAENDENVATKSHSSAGTTEDEKSVIALLDDMLQQQDEPPASAALARNDYGLRKASVDSEMLPSVIESTTIAMVHSSSDSSENDIDEVPENEENENDDGQSNSISASEKQFLCEQAANQLVLELVNSKELLDIMQKQSCIAEQDVEPASTMENAAKMSLKRAISTDSVLSVDDPLHSEQFKNKLSSLILRQPMPQPQKHESKDLTAEAINNELRKRPSSLLQSKSENDLRQLVLKAIEGTEVDIDSNDKADAPRTLSGVPKPPKFDPILYKTINSISLNRTRPALDKLLKDDTQRKPFESISTSKDAEEIAAAEPQVPFKAKLEAILKRGPSHKLQKRPSVELRRLKSFTAAVAEQQESDNAIKRFTTQDNLTAMSHKDAETNNVKRFTTYNNLPSVSAAEAEEIDNVRKRLKPVGNRSSVL